MSSEWPAIPLDELTDGTTITYGVVKPGDECEDGVKFVRGGDVVAGRILTAQLRTITPEVSQQYSRTLLRGGELLVSLVGNPGEVALVPASLKGANIARQVGLVRVDAAKADANYVQYFLRSKIGRDVLLAHSKGSVQQVINLKDLKSVKVPLPPINVQRSVAGFMQALDDRITLLRETNATLEAIAQALFKSWFVDFDPVRAKMEGRAPEGMDEATAALFPDSFEETELGAVPRGWQVKALDEIANYLNGLALQKFPATGQNDLPVIKIAQLRKGDTVGADMASRNIKPEYIIQNGDVLFSWSGSLEVEIWCGGEGALNQHLFKVTSGQFPKWFYFLWTRHHLENFRQVAASKATTMGHIQRAHLTAAKVVVPSNEVLHTADTVMAPILQRAIDNALQAKTLSTLRDTLLPRLILGQLSLSEVEY